MPHRIPSSHAACPAAMLAALLPFASPSAAPAHPLLGDCVQHRITMSAGRTYIDIEVELTFTDMRAMAERRRLDLDRDWSITREETRHAGRLLEERQTGAFGLSIDGRPVSLVPLYDPEIDLAGQPQVAPIRHAIRLFYFARTPSFLKPGSEIALADGLWPEAPAILAMTVAGTEGLRLATTSTDPFAPAGKPGLSRILRARCTAVPESGVGTADPDESDQIMQTQGHGHFPLPVSSSRLTSPSAGTGDWELAAGDTSSRSFSYFRVFVIYCLLAAVALAALIMRRYPRHHET